MPFILQTRTPEYGQLDHKIAIVLQTHTFHAAKLRLCDMQTRSEQSRTGPFSREYFADFLYL